MLPRRKLNLREKWNYYLKDNRGSAFVFVLIGIIFVTILGSTILSVATNYVLSTIVDTQSKDNFYQTEGFVGEIRSGLEEVCGDSNEAAYSGVLNSYTASSGLQDKYETEYLLGIIHILKGNTTTTWDGISTTTPEQISITPFKKMVTNPDAVSSLNADPNYILYHFEYDSTSKERALVFTGFKIDYTDKLKLETQISTDIRIETPSYNFEGGKTFDQLKDYISISDKSLTVANNSNTVTGVDGAKFKGNVYSGGDPVASSAPDIYGDGISMGAKSKADFKSNMIISRGNMIINDGSNVKITGQSEPQGELWLKNIELSGDVSGTSDNSSVLDMNEDAYVLDDLTIDADESIVKLKGKYYGYSYNQDNVDSSSSVYKADWSSAILINGLNTTLETSGLSKLVLAGRTFVERKDSADSTLVSDILMGESLAVKSNQIAYLLPDDYIKEEHNPLSKGDIAGKSHADVISQHINLASLQADQKLWPYLDQDLNNGIVNINYDNVGGFAYLYLKFKEPAQQNANAYFAQYYKGTDNRDALNEKAETYISTTDTSGMKLSANLYLLAGNIVHNYYQGKDNGGSTLQSANYYDDNGRPFMNLLEDGQNKMKNYLGKQLSLVNSGYSKAAPAYRFEDSAYQPDLVKDEIIDFGEVTDGMSYTDPDTGFTMMATVHDYTVTDAITKGLIICEGNVTVPRDFTGLILAGGRVRADGQDLDLISDPVNVGKLLKYAQNHEEWIKIFRGLKKKKENPTDVSENIYYENWKKN